MMRTRVDKTSSGLPMVVILIFLALCSLETLGQSPGGKAHDLLFPIPKHQRAKLGNRLNLLVGYQGARQWDKMYDLMLPSTRANNRRDAFVEHQQKLEVEPSISILLAFAPIEAITVDDAPEGGAWFILGCAQYRINGSIVRIKSGVTAELQNNEWFFSEISAATQIDGPEETCSTPKRSAQRTRGLPRRLKWGQACDFAIRGHSPLR